MREADQIVVLITGPSLDLNDNVSGISSVVRNILEESEPQSISGFSFQHIRLGRRDRNSGIAGIIDTLIGLAMAIFHLVRSPKRSLLHLNLALNTKSISRDFILAAIAQLSGRLILTHAHGGRYLLEDPPPLVRWLLRRIFQLSSRIIVLSSIERSFLVARYEEAAGKVAILPNSISMAQRKVEPIDVGVEGRLRVLFVGRLESEKGIPLLRDLVSRGLDGVSYRIVGSGSYRPELENMKRPELSVLGVLQGDALAAEVLHSDVLLLPSARGEGMPMAVIEAMSAGVVPIATRLASLPEVIRDRETGFLVDVDDINSVHWRLLELRDDLHLRTMMKEQAKAYAIENHDRRTNVPQLLQLYSQVILNGSQVSTG